MGWGGGWLRARARSQIHFVYSVEDLDRLVGLDALPTSLGGSAGVFDIGAWCAALEADGFDPVPITLPAAAGGVHAHSQAAPL